MSERLGSDFYQKDVLEIAPLLPGKKLVMVNDGTRSEYIITEVEAYRGSDDLACHASKGRTERTEIMFHEGGYIYMYLIYGMYWMLNVVTGREGQPQAALIRGIDKIYGPGRLTRLLGLDKTYYGESLVRSSRIWLEEGAKAMDISAATRINVDYAGKWAEKPWRFFIDSMI